jgi:hypothetical protein
MAIGVSFGAARMIVAQSSILSFMEAEVFHGSSGATNRWMKLPRLSDASILWPQNCPARALPDGSFLNQSISSWENIGMQTEAWDSSALVSGPWYTVSDLVNAAARLPVYELAVICTIFL